jgi:hypothetical protein
MCATLNIIFSLHPRRDFPAGGTVCGQELLDKHDLSKHSKWSAKTLLTERCTDVESWLAPSRSIDSKRFSRRNARTFVEMTPVAADDPRMIGCRKASR